MKKIILVLAIFFTSNFFAQSVCANWSAKLIYGHHLSSHPYSNYSVFINHQLSSNYALRFGLSLSAKTENNLPDVVFNTAVLKNNKRERQNYQINAQLVYYLFEDNKNKYYFSFGPTYYSGSETESESFYSTTNVFKSSQSRTDNINGLGLNFSAGYDYKIFSPLTVTMEIGLNVLYMWRANKVLEYFFLGEDKTRVESLCLRVGLGYQF